MNRASIQSVVGAPVLASGRDPPAIDAIGVDRAGGHTSICVATSMRGSAGRVGRAIWVFSFRGRELQSLILDTRSGRVAVSPCRAPGLVLDLVHTIAAEEPA